FPPRRSSDLRLAQGRHQLGQRGRERLSHRCSGGHHPGTVAAARCLRHGTHRAAAAEAIGLMTTWHVLGAGSLGILWASRLARAGLPVRLILRNPDRLNDYRNAGGLRLTENGQTHLYRISAELAQADTPIRRLLVRSEEHTSELQSRENLVCRLLLEKKKKKKKEKKK